MHSGVIVLGLITASFGASGGCGFSSPGARGLSDASGMPGDDAGSDGAIVDGCTTFASQFDTCRLMFSGDLMLSGTLTYDTGTHELRDDSGTIVPVMHAMFTTAEGDVDAIYAHNVRLTIGTVLRATGALPFAIVASGSITLEGATTVDLTDGGAGARATCSIPATIGGSNSGGGAGGGGGGFSGAGGNGGGGNSNGSTSSKTTGGAGARTIALPQGPVGGCAGAPGGAGMGAGGAGGLGGGALYLVAADRIDLLGILTNRAVLVAGGGGGKGGQSANGGGGGGGSGGMVWLEALHVNGPNSVIAANGGGGGQGGDSMAAGNDGKAGTASLISAPGGTLGSVNGGDGGRGGAGGDPSGETVATAATTGGGGGGGGVGYIRVMSADKQLGTVSPAAR